MRLLAATYRAPAERTRDRALDVTAEYRAIGARPYAARLLGFETDDVRVGAVRERGARSVRVSPRPGTLGVGFAWGVGMRWRGRPSAVPSLSVVGPDTEFDNDLDGTGMVLRLGLAPAPVDRLRADDAAACAIRRWGEPGVRRVPTIAPAEWRLQREILEAVRLAECARGAGWQVQRALGCVADGEVVVTAGVQALRPGRQVRVLGGDLERVNFEWMEPARKIRIAIDQDEVRRLGLSSSAVAQSLDLIVNGRTVTRIRDDIYLVPVIVREEGGRTLSPATLRNLRIALPNGRSVPLSQLARLDDVQAKPLSWRRDRVPTLTVRADPAPGVLPATVVDRLAPAMDAVRADLPAGYDITVGGTVEESEASQASVFAVVPSMLLLVFTFLMFQLKSFQRLVLVSSVVPLGLIGVVAALLAGGRPLGFVAILGILALVGMIAKNAVSLIEQIEGERRAGKAVRTAVLDAASSPLRPILLTALSTVLGLIPIAFTVFWGTMAYAIMGGLLVASLLTLIFLPTLYVTWFRGRPGAVPAA